MTDRSRQLFILGWLLDNRTILDKADVDPKKWVEAARQDLSAHTRTTANFLYQGRKYLSRISQLIILLRECMLLHRWKDALHIGKELAARKDLNPALKPFFRTTMESLMQMDDQETLGKFIKLAKVTIGNTGFAGRELQVVELSKCLEDNDFERVQELVKAPKAVPLCHVDDRLRYFTLNLSLLHGMVYYAEWHTLLLKKDDVDDFDVMERNSPYDEAMHILATKACLCFQSLQKHPYGVWDIFITRHVKILEHYEKEEEALKLLKTYSEKNGDKNPNAHLYLYDFHKRQRKEDNFLIEALEPAVKVAPALSRVLDLCKLYRKNGNLVKCVAPLLSMLDHVCWQNVLKPWRFLADVILEILQRNDKEGVVALQKHCDERKTWWPLYHFTMAKLHEAPDIDLVVNKAVCCCLMLGSDCDFVQCAMNMDIVDRSLREKLENAIRLNPCSSEASMDWSPADVEHTTSHVSSQDSVRVIEI